MLIELLPRLWKPAGSPFRTLSEEAEWWVGSLRNNAASVERDLLDAAIKALEELAPTQGEQVLLHQDLHAENVMSAEREPWLAIDPKPLVGEREFGLASIIRSSELGHSERAVRHRLDRLTSELGLDRERARKWALGQTIAWTSNGESGSTHVETARWLLQAG